jgi:hypothetical protein
VDVLAGVFRPGAFLKDNGVSRRATMATVFVSYRF